MEKVIETVFHHHQLKSSHLAVKERELLLTVLHVDGVSLGEEETSGWGGTKQRD